MDAHNRTQPRPAHSKREDAKQILKALMSCLPDGSHELALHEPSFTGNEWRYVKDCLDTSMVSSVGTYMEKFEKKLVDLTGVPYAVSVVNGTAGLHTALHVADVGPNNEVLVPALTFVATANAVAYCRAVPHFVESDYLTLGVDAGKLNKWLSKIAVRKNGATHNRRTGRRIKALICVHTFGHPVDLDALSDTCEHFKIALIEDAAEAIGSYYKDKHVGRWGMISVLSFNGNKTVTTGGGGALLTKNGKLAKLIKHITTTAKIPHAWKYDHDRVGFNYRLPNLNAALGCAQLESLPALLEKKRKLAHTYAEAFRHVGGAALFSEPPFAKSNYWLNTLIFDKGNLGLRDEFIRQAHDNRIRVRPVWRLMHKLPMFLNCPKADVTVSEDLERRIVNIPSSPFLS